MGTWREMRMLSDAMDRFLREQKLRGNSPRTVEYYEGNFARFRAVTGIETLEDLTPDAISDWLLSLQEAGMSPHSVRTYDRAIRAFCNWLERTGRVEVSPMRQVPRLREPRSEPRPVFSPEDVRRMMEVAAEPGKPNRLRDQMLIAVLLDTGIRAGELASIRMSSIDWDEGVIQVSGKTGGRPVPAGKSLRYVRRYVAHERRSEGRSDHLVTSRIGRPISARDITVAVRRLSIKVGVESAKLGPHTFRHTFAMEYLRNGGDVFSLKRILGHSQLKTTERYVQWLTGDVVEAHRRHSPAKSWL